MASSEVHLDAFLFRDLRWLSGWFARVVICHSLILLATSQSFGQPVALSLSSATATPGSSAALTISTAAGGGVQPSSLKWTLQYPVDVIGVVVSPGPSAANS